MKLLSEPARVRLLILLQKHELSVVEMQEILKFGQSRISNYLSDLRNSGLVTDRHEGKSRYYSITMEIPEEIRCILDGALKVSSRLEETKLDQQRLKIILDRRKEQTRQHFNALAGKLGKDNVPGRSWESLSHLLLRLVPRVDIADLGAGEGYISFLMAKRAYHVYAIDSSEKMIQVGRDLARKQNLGNLEFLLGDLESPPLPDNSVDIAIFSQALHHAPSPRQAIQSAFRILRPGGQILILDLKAHKMKAVRDLYADLWQGFHEPELEIWMQEAGFHDVEVRVVSKDARKPAFETLLGEGIKP